MPFLFKKKEITKVFGVLGRKGMSPLIVTILLIALAVALGAMIMNWTSEAVADVPGGNCDDTRIEPQAAFGGELVCFDEAEGLIRIVVKNSGRTTLNSIIYRRITPDLRAVDTGMPNSRLRPGDIYEGSIKHDHAENVHLELIPEIIVGGVPTLCPDKSLVRESLRRC